MSARATRLIIALINALGFGWIALAEAKHVPKPPGGTLVSAIHPGTDDQTFHPEKEYATDEKPADEADPKKEAAPTRKPQSNPENPTE